MLNPLTSEYNWSRKSFAINKHDIQNENKGLDLKVIIDPAKNLYDQHLNKNSNNINSLKNERNQEEENNNLSNKKKDSKTTYVNSKSKSEKDKISELKKLFLNKVYEN